MRKLLIGFFIIIGFISASEGPLKLINTAIAQQKPIPPYAKWGTFAMEKTQERYPNAKIIDYLHIGRIRGPHSSTERFKLWLKVNTREFGVFINIEFNNETGKVINVTFKESSR